MRAKRLKLLSLVMLILTGLLVLSNLDFAESLRLSETSLRWRGAIPDEVFVTSLPHKPLESITQETVRTVESQYPLQSAERSFRIYSYKSGAFLMREWKEFPWLLVRTRCSEDGKRFAAIFSLDDVRDRGVVQLDSPCGDAGGWVLLEQ